MVNKGNNIITIDGIRYKLSPADWNLHQQILSRSRVVNITPDKLINVAVERLVGHADVVYYNCETNAWNTNKYNGYTIISQDVDTQRVKEFESVMEKIPKFSQQYEFVASMTMTIDKAAYPGCGRLISNPKYKHKGSAVVGNIIVKNKATGKYELYCKSWLGVRDYEFPYDAVDGGARWFASCGAWNSDFREALIVAHTR